MRESFDVTLPVVSSFEGTGWDGVVGNFDGALLTFGIIGFNIKQGSGVTLLETMFRRQPLTSSELVSYVQWEPTWGRQNWEKWASSITQKGKTSVDPEIRPRLKLAIGGKVGRQEQENQAWAFYGARAAQYCRQFGFTTMRQYLLALDTTVQQGGFRGQALTLWKKNRSLRELAEYMSSLALPQWRSDVLARRLCIVNGLGKVHGQNRNLSKEYPLLRLDGPILSSGGASVGEDPSIELKPLISKR